MTRRPRTATARRALLIVENEFLTHHVGVRRVIGHYWNRLDRSGYQVDLAVAQDGLLTTLSERDRDRARTVVLARHPGTSQPTWTSDEPDIPEPSTPAAGPGTTDVWEWRGDEAHPADYDVSVLTNPWMCARDVPPGDYTHGIVYDLVPNLISAGALDMREFVEVNAFAHEHHVGYQFYETYARTLSCISECTRRDLLRFYLRGRAERAVVDIPFDSPPADGESGRREADDGPARVLLVNALDPRKNVTGLRTVLTTLAEEGRELAVSVVGRERMPWHAVKAFFTDLAEAGIHVEWFRGASDDRLQQLYRSSDVLFFPSLYEGLGLPILEAQAEGLPVVSSSTSSCGEINLNPVLTSEPLDLDSLAETLRGCLDDASDVLRGQDLRAAQEDLVSNKGRGLPWGMPDAHGTDRGEAGTPPPAA